MSDLVAVIPYVLPLLFMGVMLLLFQRHLPQTQPRRKVMVFGTLFCFVSSILLVAYAGFGSYWWLPGDHPTIGSWLLFVSVLQWLTDSIFGSILGGVAYIAVLVVVFTLVARSVISPPNPDFVALREELKTAQDSSGHLKSENQKLATDNKRLTEFVSEKEESLKKLQSELALLKEHAGESSKEKARLEEEIRIAAENALAEKEQEFLDTVSKKDQTIGTLQSQIGELKAALQAAAGRAPSAAGTPKTESKMSEAQARLNEIANRSETAAEVSDSVISELAELMSQIESSRLDPAAKITLTTLIEALGKSVGKLSRAAETRPKDDPKVELIGVVMMVHEVIDTVKRTIRSVQ
jgi:uncharacterized phage infection (PIP) family protein YhgE